MNTNENNKEDVSLNDVETENSVNVDADDSGMETTPSMINESVISGPGAISTPMVTKTREKELSLNDLFNLINNRFDMNNSNFNKKFDEQNTKFDELKTQIYEINKRFENTNEIIETSCNRLEPVSYTHLDVYKRQI